MHVDEVDSCLFHDFAAPLAVAVVAALHLAVRPFVARRDAQEYGYAALLADVADELAQIPAVGIDDLIDASVGHEVDFAFVGRARNLGAERPLVDVAHVVVSELDDHIVTGLYAVVYPVPASLVEEGAGAAPGLSGVEDRDAGGVEHGVEHAAPAPHAVRVGVGVLYRAVSGHDQGGSAGSPADVESLGIKREQIVPEVAFAAGGYAFGCAAGVVHCPESTGVDVVPVEHVSGLVLSEFLQFPCAYVLKVYDRSAGLLPDFSDPLVKGVGFASDFSVLVPLVARGEGEEYRSRPLGTHLGDEAAQVFAVAEHSLAAPCLRNGHHKAVPSGAGNRRAGSSAVVGAAVVVSQLYDHIVARTHALDHVGPPDAVECAA